ncbi:hypothetical protein HRG84_19085 [Flavisolibacter sp. BT320]|nr:hypothetical protein [Flavisolibacter longurius]
MLDKTALEQRRDDLEFLKRIIKRGRTMSMYEGSRFLAIAPAYAVENWCLCRELNPAYYDEIAVISKAGWDHLNPSLN